LGINLNITCRYGIVRWNLNIINWRGVFAAVNILEQKMTDGLKLFVDDWRQPPDGWYLAKTITEAIRILSGPIYVEVVSLDHDIIFETRTKDTNRPKLEFSGENFTAVAYYIVLLPFGRLPKIVYIHTANPRGANDIEDILKDVVPTQRLGDSTSFDLSAPSTYKEDLIKFEQEREQQEKKDG
jgi:hypothetical protein